MAWQPENVWIFSPVIVQLSSYSCSSYDLSNLNTAMTESGFFQRNTTTLGWKNWIKTDLISGCTVGLYSFMVLRISSAFWCDYPH
jgi:hypothetical protein